jgi:hypothetical protein
MTWFGEAAQRALTGARAGMDSAWEQKKLEARKNPENAAREAPQHQVHTLVGSVFEIKKYSIKNRTHIVFCLLNLFWQWSLISKIYCWYQIESHPMP